jgi:tetratricopeptide (TPR) repeat protein
MHGRCSPSRVIVSLAVVSACCLTDAAVGLDGPSRAYLKGLRDRRLFSVAETYCFRRLDDPELSAAERIDYTVELSRALVQHAAWRTGQEQEELWARARSVVDDELRRDPEHPRSDALRLQLTLVPAAKAQLLAWQTQIAPFDDALRSRAIEQLQSVLKTLSEIEVHLSERTRLARNPSPADRAAGAPTPGDLRDLAQEAGLTLAAINVELGRLLPAGAERTAAVQEAETRLGSLVRQALPDEMEWEARLLRIQAARLGGQLDQAQSLVDALLRSEPPPFVRARGLAESIRVDLARERPDDALARLLAEQQQSPAISEELRGLNVEALLAAREAALIRGDQQLADELLAEAERTLQQVKGPWGARAGALLSIARDGAAYGNDVAAKVLAGRAAFQNGDAAAAANLYAEAVSLARAAQRADIVPELLSTRASILLQSGDYEQAARDFIAVAEDPLAGDRAAQAHLLYAYCLGKLWEERATQSRREAYATALNEHRTRFADDPTFVEATWMLAAFEEVRQQWTVALELYATIPTDHERGPAARARVSALFEQVLARLREIGRETDSWEDLAVAQLTGYLDAMPPSPARLAPLEADVVLRLARILLNHRSPDYVAADAQLDRVIGSSQAAIREAETGGQQPDPAWTARYNVAIQLRIVSLAGQNRVNEALTILESLPVSDPKALLAVLNGLSEVSAGSDDERKRALGELQLKAAEPLLERPDQLEADDARLLDACLAQAYVAVDRPNDAIAVYERLLAGAPHDRRLLRTAAELLAESSNTAAWEKSQRYWLRLEELEKPGTPQWFAARLQVATMSLKLDRREECRKLLNVTRVLFPELGGPEVSVKFEALQAELDGE